MVFCFFSFGAVHLVKVRVSIGDHLLNYLFALLPSLFRFVRDATVAMTISFSLFVFPSEIPRIYAPDGSGEQGSSINAAIALDL